MSETHFRITSAIICDEVRFEVTNKLILLGVYTGDIIVPSFPAALSLSIYVVIEDLALGEHQFELRLTGSDMRAEVEGQVHVEAAGPVGLPTPQVSMQFRNAGTMTLDIKVNDGEWMKVLEKKVAQGTVQGPNQQ